MDSIWTDNINFKKFEKLKGNIKTDVLIIGGGIAGILCAYMLKEKGVDYTLVESKRICSGITKNTTAKITFQHGLLYAKMLKSKGYEKTQLFIESQKRAMKEYARLCSNIDCDYEEKNAYTYSLRNEAKIESETKALLRVGVDARYVSLLPLPLKIKGAVCVPNQAQLNPLKFIQEISKDLNIYEETKVQELSKCLAKTENGEIRFKKAIIATHFPILNKHGGYFLKMYQHRSYVIALENAQAVNGMYVDENIKGMSFRDYNDVLLLGGGSHRTGKKVVIGRSLRILSKEITMNREL